MSPLEDENEDEFRRHSKDHTRMRAGIYGSLDIKVFKPQFFSKAEIGFCLYLCMESDICKF